MVGDEDDLVVIHPGEPWQPWEPDPEPRDFWGGVILAWLIVLTVAVIVLYVRG